MPGGDWPRKLPSKKHRDVIRRVWHVDYLRCPVCQNLMRAIAVMVDPRVAHHPRSAEYMGGAPKTKFLSIDSLALFWFQSATLTP